MFGIGLFALFVVGNLFFIVLRQEPFDSSRFDSATSTGYAYSKWTQNLSRSTTPVSMSQQRALSGSSSDYDSIVLTASRVDANRNSVAAVEPTLTPKECKLVVSNPDGSAATNVQASVFQAADTTCSWSITYNWNFGCTVFGTTSLGCQPGCNRCYQNFPGEPTLCEVVYTKCDPVGGAVVSESVLNQQYTFFASAGWNRAAPTETEIRNLESAPDPALINPPKKDNIYVTPNDPVIIDVVDNTTGKTQKAIVTEDGQIKQKSLINKPFELFKLSGGTASIIIGLVLIAL